MTDKWKKFKEEIDRLIRLGEELETAINFEVNRDELVPDLVEELGVEGFEYYVHNLRNFTREYQAWYTEGFATVKQLLPDRFEDFANFYECPRVRKDITRENYVIRDYLQGTSFTVGPGSMFPAGRAAIRSFIQQLNIVRTARSTLESSLVNFTAILQADLFDSEVDTAAALKKAGHLRAAGAICGVVLEKHLHQLCINHKLKITKKKPTLSDLYSVLKDHEVIATPDWRSIQHLADIRNLCSHDKGIEPTEEQLEDLLTGTKKVIKKVN